MSFAQDASPIVRVRAERVTSRAQPSEGQRSAAFVGDPSEMGRRSVGSGLLEEAEQFAVPVGRAERGLEGRRTSPRLSVGATRFRARVVVRSWWPARSRPPPGPAAAIRYGGHLPANAAQRRADRAQRSGGGEIIGSAMEPGNEKGSSRLEW